MPPGSPGFDPEDNLFLLAGPVKMHPRVVQAMARPAINHRGPEFAALYKEMHDLLQSLFQTQNPLAMLTGSGTSAMEAAIASTVAKQDRVVALDNGNFGQRMATLAGLFATVETVKAEWGQPVDVGKVEDALRRGARAVVLTHNETSTGFTNPLRDIAKLAHAHGALVIADCITSVGGMPVPVDEWGVDLAITGSQKCIGAPPGMAFVSVSQAAERAMDSKRGFYLNLLKYLDKWRKEGQCPFTPNTHLAFACLEGLRMIREQGLGARFRLVERTAKATRDAAKALGLKLLPASGYESNTVTAMRLPEGIEDAKFRGSLKDEHGVVLSGGQGALKGTIFRIGHMGTVDVKDIAAGMTAVEAVLLKLGWKCQPGSAAAAVERYF